MKRLLSVLLFLIFILSACTSRNSEATLDKTQSPGVTPVSAYLGNLQDPTTWPTDFEGMNLQDYWKRTDFSPDGRSDLTTAASEDKIFDYFVNLSMKQILTENGVETKNLSEDQIFDEYVKWGQKNSQILTISPLRLRNMMGDINNYLTLAYTDDDGPHMGVFSLGLPYYKADFPERARSVIPTQGVLNLKVFGVNTHIPDKFFYGGVYGYLNLFRFPHLDAETQAIGILQSYPDYEDPKTTRYFPAMVNYLTVDLPKGSEIFIHSDLESIFSVTTLSEDDQLPPTIFNRNLNGSGEISLEILRGLIGQKINIEDGAVTKNGLTDVDVYPYEFGIPQTFSVDIN